MCPPPHFREERIETLHSHVRARRLGTLMTAGPGGLLANLVHFLLTGGGEIGILRANVARANDQVEALRSRAENLVLFQGPEERIRAEVEALTASQEQKR